MVATRLGMDEASTAGDPKARPDPKAITSPPTAEFDAEQEALSHLQSKCRWYGVREPGTCVEAMNLAQSLLSSDISHSWFTSQMERMAQAHGALLQTVVESIETLRTQLGEPTVVRGVPGFLVENLEGYVLDGSRSPRSGSLRSSASPVSFPTAGGALQSNDTPEHHPKRRRGIEGTDTASGENCTNPVVEPLGRMKARREMMLRGFGYGGIRPGKHPQDD